MIKVMHSADWHLDAPMTGHKPEDAEFLRQEQRKIPGKIAQLCRKNSCSLLLLSGDLFDGAYTQESVNLVRKTLGDLKIPVFVSPGNHDFCQPGSPWLEESWPENVHVFTKAEIRSVYLEELDCKIYGAGYESMDCPALLKAFQAEGEARWHFGVFHADPTSASSPYCPVTAQQVRETGLDYLALGHIHKAGSFRSGEVLCAWPGCPMGHGFDEDGTKGVILLTLDEEIHPEFIPLDTPRFFDLEADAGDAPGEAVAALLPPAETADFYRITLTGYAATPDLDAIREENPQVPHLTLRDQTMPEMDIWSALEEDTLEGAYFRLLRSATESQSQSQQKYAKMAARISRQLLDGQEVKLP